MSTTNEPTDMMGYDTPEEVPTPKETPQEVMNRMMKEVKTDDEGKYIYPEDIDPLMKLAMANAKSYRDTQSGFTKSQQSLKEAEAERDALVKQLAEHSQKPLELSTEDQTELDKLYLEDPHAWRAKVNMLEQQSQDAVKEELTKVTDEVKQKAGAEYELERRFAYLEEFNSTRGDNQITTEMLDNDIPPRINKKLAEGSLTFESYMAEVSNYLDAGRVVSKETPPNTTDLNKSNGSQSPNGQTKQEEEGAISYGNQTF